VPPDSAPSGSAPGAGLPAITYSWPAVTWPSTTTGMRLPIASLPITPSARVAFSRTWEADLVPVTISLVNRTEAKTVGMDTREPAQFLHDALPRARRFLDQFDHRGENLSGC
jgi:hypothetical protein